MSEMSKSNVMVKISPNLVELQEILAEKISTFEPQEIVPKLSLINDLQLNPETDLVPLIRTINRHFKITIDADELDDLYENLGDLRVGDLLEAIDDEMELG